MVIMAKNGIKNMPKNWAKSTATEKLQKETPFLDQNTISFQFKMDNII